MTNYKRYSLALNEAEEKQFRKTGLGIKKIFKAILDALAPVKEETIGDGVNKSSIMVQTLQASEVQQASRLSATSQVSQAAEEEI